MSLYAEYIRELSQGDVLETDKGFATYVFPDDTTCYIREIYVRPAFREQNAASAMADLIVEKAKNRGCKTLLGSVTPSAKGSTTSLRVLLAYGFSLLSSSNDYILFQKEIH